MTQGVVFERRDVLPHLCSPVEVCAFPELRYTVGNESAVGGARCRPRTIPRSLIETARLRLVVIFPRLREAFRTGLAN